MVAYDPLSPNDDVALFRVAPAFWEAFGVLSEKQQEVVMGALQALSTDLASCLFAAIVKDLAGYAKREPRLADVASFLHADADVVTLTRGPYEITVRRLQEFFLVVGMQVSSVH